MQPAGFLGGTQNFTSSKLKNTQEPTGNGKVIMRQCDIDFIWKEIQYLQKKVKVAEHKMGKCSTTDENNGLHRELQDKVMEGNSS